MSAAFPPDESPYHWHVYPMKDVSKAILGVTVTLQVLVLMVVGMRFYSRIKTAKLGWDDFWVLVATVLSIGTLTTTICFHVLGSGYLLAEVAINMGTLYLLIFIIQVFFIFATASCKISICCFYLRIFVGRGMRIATYITMGLAVLWAISIQLAATFICKPIQGQWDLRLAAVTKCGDQSKFFQAGLSINAVLDFVILVLPMYTIWNLNMRRSDKIGLFFAFSIGIAILTVSIIRPIYVIRTAIRGDLTATLPTNLFLTIFEQQLAIITISIPMLRPLWSRFRNRSTGYDVERSDSSEHAAKKRPSSRVTIGGTVRNGKKSWNKLKHQGDSVLETHGTQLELRDVYYEMKVDAGHPSEGSVWDARNNTSETALDISRDNGGIRVKNEWKVLKS